MDIFAYIYNSASKSLIQSVNRCNLLLMMYLWVWNDTVVWELVLQATVFYSSRWVFLRTSNSALSCSILSPIDRCSFCLSKAGRRSRSADHLGVNSVGGISRVHWLWKGTSKVSTQPAKDPSNIPNMHVVHVYPHRPDFNDEGSGTLYTIAHHPLIPSLRCSP